MGGLGNQLFQIFATISYAMRTKQKFVFLKIHKTGGGETKIRDTYWNNLLHRLELFLSNDFPNYILTRETGFTFNDIISEININKINNNTCLYGYFQSYKYFQDNYDLIYRLLDIDNQKKQISKSYSDFALKNTVSMHFRLGDYKVHTDIYPILTYDYYEKAFEYIQKHNLYYLNILFFCEDEDLDEVNIIVEKLKNRFNHNGIRRASNTLKDWEQMLLMSCCNYNIIANSSFSWWGAYFNSNPDKIVCYPETWFINNIDTSDLCPLEWIKI
jgi:hypothetical protein